MKRLLVINPNSSLAVTRRLRETAELCLSGEASVHVETAEDGPAYLGDAATLNAGEAAAIAIGQRLHERGRPFDAIILGCFADIAVAQLRRTLGVPVCSLLGASLLAAMKIGKRVGIVTAGAQWRGLLPPMVMPYLQLGRSGLAGIRTIETTGTAIAERPEIAARALGDAVRECQEQDGADVIIVGGAGLAGLAHRLDLPAGLAVIDSVEAGLRQGLLSGSEERQN